MGKWTDRMHGGGGQPQVRSSYDTSAGFGTIMGAGTMEDSQEAQIRWFASQRFPDDPKAVDRYDVIDGDIVYQGDDGNFYQEIPDPDGIGTAAKMATYGVPGALAAAPAIATGIATAPMWLAGPAGMATSVALTGGASALGHGAKEAVGNLLTGDPVNMGRVATNAALDVAGEGIGYKLAQRGANKMLASQFGDNILAGGSAPARAADPGVFQPDIPLTVGQRTGNPAIIAREDAARQFVQSRNIMASADSARTEAIHTNISRFLDSISPIDDLDAIGRIAQETADEGTRRVSGNMAAKARPHYQAAFSSGADVDIDPVLDLITDRAQGAKEVRGQLSNIYQKVYRLMHSTESDEALRDVESLHYVKKELDAMMDKTSPKWAGKTIDSFLADVKKTLLTQIDAASPAYAKARGIYEDLYPAREAGEQVNAILSRIKDQKLHKVASSLFEDTSQTSIQQAKTLFNVADPSGEAWSAVVRGYLQKNYLDAAREYATGNPDLVGGKFAARIFKNAYQRENIRAALTPQQYKGLTYLLDDLMASAKGIVTNSATMSRQEVMKEAERSAENLLTMAGDRFDLQNPLKILPGFVKELNQGRYWREFAEVTTSPDGLRRLDVIAGLPKNSLKRKVAVAQVISSIIGGTVDDAMLPLSQEEALLTAPL